MLRENFLKEIDKIKRVVIKIGSNLIIDNKTNEIQYKNLENLLNSIIYLKSLNKQVIVVSSGAVALGRNKLKRILKDYVPQQFPSIIRKQALASVGQIELMKFYDEFFSKKNIGISQILITAKDFRDRETYLNIGHTIQEILNFDLVPIINENDTVATEELKFGDNDFLSAATAALLHSQLLILLTSVEGFLINNKRISSIDKIDEEIIKHARGPEGYGSGGMYSKIRVGKLCQIAGVHVAILPGNVDDVVQKFFSGVDVGTLIYAQNKFLKARKKWLLFARTKGTVVIDEGAEDALKNKGSSLLLAGIKQIQGNFTYGDVVEIRNMKNDILGRGIINIPSRIIRNHFNGKQETNSKNLLQYFPFEVIHRNDLILEL